MRTSLYDYCVERSELALLTQWHPTKNLPLTPEQVLPGAKRKSGGGAVRAMSGRRRSAPV